MPVLYWMSLIRDLPSDILPPRYNELIDLIKVHSIYGDVQIDLLFAEGLKFCSAIYIFNPFISVVHGAGG